MARPAPSVRLAALAAAAALALVAPAAPAQEATAPRVERWYELIRNGTKRGYLKVTWAPSTWEGRKTLHDTTTVVRRSSRDMGGVKSLFETTTRLDLERSEDGTLWWERITVEESGRTSVTEITWTGSGYVHESGIVGQERQRVEIPLEEPVEVDAEAFVGPMIRDGEVAEGDVLELRILDVAARGARALEVAVEGRETVADAGGQAETTKIVQTDPLTGGETVLWIDGTGAFVQIRDGAGNLFRRVTRQQAEDMPVEPASYSVTTSATPTLERIFTADRLRVEVHVQGDPHRQEPELPDSPWSRTLSVEGSDEEGWVYELELTSHDDPSARATLDEVDPDAFARELEPTVLMPCRHPRIVETARRVVGDETRIREAAYLLARHVHETLRKSSPQVGEATALELLDDPRGDCSEHATLFVTLARAIGIPTRRCSGYVCLGSVWGKHAWAEIWAGEWISADPTTGEVGGGARYLFFGYRDTPGSFPDVVTNRTTGRLRFVTTSVEGEGQEWDLTDPSRFRIREPERGYYNHVLAGIELTDVPPEWRVHLAGDTTVMLQKGPFMAHIDCYADQGSNLTSWGGGNDTFAGRRALKYSQGEGRFSLWLHSRRKIFRINVTGAKDEADLAELEEILAPALAPWDPAAEEEDGDEESDDTVAEEAQTPEPSPGAGD